MTPSQTVKAAPKPNPQLPDAAVGRSQERYHRRSPQRLGLAALVRKKYDVAVAEFKTAADGSAHPEPATRCGWHRPAVAGKNDEAIAICDKVMADRRFIRRSGRWPRRFAPPRSRRAGRTPRPPAATAPRRPGGSAPSREEAVSFRTCARSWHRSSRESTTGSLTRSCCAAR